MLFEGKDIRRLSLNSGDKSLNKKLMKEESRAFIIKVSAGVIFLVVGIYLTLKDIQYADAELKMRAPGIEIEVNCLVPGVLCLIFGFILILFARINITVKNDK